MEKHEESSPFFFLLSTSLRTRRGGGGENKESLGRKERKSQTYSLEVIFSETLETVESDQTSCS